MLEKQLSSEVGAAHALQFQRRSPVAKALTRGTFPSGDSLTNPALSVAVPLGELCGCEGWNEARTVPSHCSSCVCWLATLAALHHLGSLMFHQQSFPIKILNQSSDYQFQTRGAAVRASLSCNGLNSNVCTIDWCFDLSCCLYLM